MCEAGHRGELGRGPFRQMVPVTFFPPPFGRAEGTKEILYDRMVKRIAERPELLSELADRIEHDDVVD